MKYIIPKMICFNHFLISGQNHNISWANHRQSNSSVDYKFFGISVTNSVKLDYMKNLPIRYPFADVFIYEYNQTRNEFRYKSQWKNWVKGGLRSMDLSGGTKLITFGDFKTRISVDMKRYLRVCGYNNWQSVGVTQSYNHAKDDWQTEYKFQMTPKLYAPAYPFRLESIVSKEFGANSTTQITQYT